MIVLHLVSFLSPHCIIGSVILFDLLLNQRQPGDVLANSVESNALPQVSQSLFNIDEEYSC